MCHRTQFTTRPNWERNTQQLTINPSCDIWRLSPFVLSVFGRDRDRWVKLGWIRSRGSSRSRTRSVIFCRTCSYLKRECRSSFWKECNMNQLTCRVRQQNIDKINQKTFYSGIQSQQLKSSNLSQITLFQLPITESHHANAWWYS